MPLLVDNNIVFYINKGNIEWLDGQKSRCLLLWRSPEEWGEHILNWVSWLIVF